MRLYGVWLLRNFEEGELIDNRLYTDKIQAQSALDIFSKEGAGDCRIEDYEVDMEGYLKTYIEKVTEIIEATMKGSEYYIEVTRDVFDYRNIQIMAKGEIYPVTRIKFNEKRGGLTVFAMYKGIIGQEADIDMDHIGRLGRRDAEGYCKLVKKEPADAK